jgi:MFS superfamily sulfate permease-like transporter
VVLATFAITLMHDLTARIVAGCALSAVRALLHRPVAEEGA